MESVSTTSQNTLNVLDEFILLLINEHSGYFHQVEGWNLSCAIIGAVLADLSLKARIDTDENSLILLDETKTGEPNLDLCLEEIVKSPSSQNTDYWIEYLSIHSENIIDSILKKLISLNAITYHDGDFYTLNNFTSNLKSSEHSIQKNWIEDTKLEIEEVIFTDIIPSPRVSLLVGILKSCDVVRFIFNLNEENEAKVDWICGLELITRNIVSSLERISQIPALQRLPLGRNIPKVSLKRLLLNRHVYDGNIPALFSYIYNNYGPVFKIKLPFQKPVLFMAGLAVNQWMHRNARLYMTSGNYFRELEEACGAQALITSMDGADHFRMRRIMRNVYTADKFIARLDDVCQLTRQFMSSQGWQSGSKIEVKKDTRLLINSQMTAITVNTDSQDIFEDLAKWKERASICYVGKLMPNILARTPEMKRRFKLLDAFMKRIKKNNIPIKRAGCPRELADEVFSIHGSDPQFLPEQNLTFILAAAPILQSIYVGDLLGFAVFEMARHPEFLARIREEANNLFDDGIPDKNKFTPGAYDVTNRFLMECLRMYPVVSMQVRNVANSCVVEGFALPLGERIHIMQSAAHYTDESFSDPYRFDIDRYLPPRNEHQSRGYAPYGLGTHMCVGYAWMNLQMIVSILLIAYHFDFAPLPKAFKLRINPFPTLSVSKKLKIRIVRQLRELPS